MKKKSIENSDTLIKHIHSTAMEKAEAEMVAMYGQRYVEYRNQWQIAGELKYEPPFPLYLMLEQTYRCNLRCISCIHGYPDLRKKYDIGVSSMPWDLYERIVLEGEEHQCPSISTHNNDEPLLVKDLAKRINFARKHGFMDVIMTTNGVLFTEDKIKEVIDAGVTRILFSLDALTEETYNKVRPGGNYNKVLWAIEKALAYRESMNVHIPIIRVSFVPNAVNQHELVPFIEKFSAIVDYIDVQPFCTYYDANLHLIPYGSNKITDFRCNGPWKFLIVRGNGEVLPCPNFYGAEVVVENINQKTLYEIFNSPRMKQMRQEFKEGIYKHKACIECAQSAHLCAANN